jgi:secreted trypsin-like serine protease
MPRIFGNQIGEQVEFNASVVEVLVGGFDSCTGTVVGSRYVLTAAHCLLHETLNENDNNVTIVRHVEGVRTTHRVSQQLIHPCYQFAGNWIGNDLALLLLRDFEFPSAAILPIDGIHQQISDVGSVVAAGYGTGLRQLRQVALRTTSIADCEIANPYVVHRGTNFSNLICTSSDSGGICSGDAGGPLVSQSATPWLVGVISRVSGIPYLDQMRCDDVGRLGVSIRILPYARWISSVLHRVKIPVEYGSSICGQDHNFDPPAIVPLRVPVQVSIEVSYENDSLVWYVPSVLACLITCTCIAACCWRRICMRSVVETIPTASTSVPSARAAAVMVLPEVPTHDPEIPRGIAVHAVVQ